MKKIFHAVFVLVIATVGFNISVSNAQETPEKEWTIAVFLNGDNNLDSYGKKDMDEMEKVGSDTNVNIVVLRDTSKTNISSKIYYVEKGSSKVVKDFGSNIDMGDYRNLVDFFKFVKENYPAKRFLVDVWNHGSGWRQMSDPISKGISYDDHSGNYITTPQLGVAFGEMKQLNNGKNVDILGMDACLMQMAEVGYEVSSSVDVVVGSEDTEPSAGWAYDQFLPYLVQKPQMSAEELGSVIEREYVKSYSNGSQGSSATQGSAISTAKLVAALGKLEDVLQYLSSTMSSNTNVLANAVQNAQRFYEAEFKDLIHFLELVKDATTDTHLKDLSEQAVLSLREVVIANFTNGSSLANSRGFAVWVPTIDGYNYKSKAYAELRWAKETGWNNFLKKMLIPSTPVVSFQSFGLIDENGDGLLTPGEKVNFKVGLKNTSPIAGKDATLYMTPPCSFTNYLESVAIPSIPKGAVVVDGLWAEIPKDIQMGMHTFEFRLYIPGTGDVVARQAFFVDKEYIYEKSDIASPHNYPASFDKTWTISKPGSVGMKIHFSRIDTEPGYDFIYVYDKNDKLIEKYDGKKGPLWTSFINGDTVKVRFISDNVVNYYGFDIDKIAY